MDASDCGVRLGEVPMKRTFEARRWPVRLPALGAAVLVAAVVVMTAAAASGPVASGLVNPRGITTGPGGRLLVVESGTGVIDELRKGGSQTFATVPGAVDVATNGLGNTYAVIGGPGPDAPPPPPAPTSHAWSESRRTATSSWWPTSVPTR